MKTPNEEFAIPNLEDEVTLLYFTNNKGKIYCYDMVQILPILEIGSDTLYAKSIFIYKYNPLK